MIRRLFGRGTDQGAVLVHVAVTLLGLLAFSAFTIDYGVMWLARRQAQNAADAAALAAAISMAYDAPGDYDRARAQAKAVGEQNGIFGAVPSIVQGAGNNADITQDISFPTCPEGTPGPTTQCVRVNVYRTEAGKMTGGGTPNPLPTFFATLFGRTIQGVKATATAQWATGNQIECLLPFAAIDRWSDSFDNDPDPTYWTNDPTLDPGIDGWTPNDHYQPSGTAGETNGCTGGTCDTYVAPYDGNTNHTGWKVDDDYGRQLIIKAGSLSDKVYSAGWALQVDLPESTGSNDYNWNIENCNEQPVGIAEEPDLCDAVDEAEGCISIKTGMAQGPTSNGINDVVAYDSGAAWSWSGDGPQGEGEGGIVGGMGWATPRIRPMVVLDIDHYMAQGCSGTTCIGKIANIIGFFVEGMCKDVTLDPGMDCPDPNKDVVGRIVTLPSTVAAGAGEVEEDAAFLTLVRLVR